MFILNLSLSPNSTRQSNYCLKITKYEKDPIEKTLGIEPKEEPKPEAVEKKEPLKKEVE